MGNKTSKDSGSAGDPAGQETAHVQAIFNEMSSQTQGPKTLSKTSLVKHFPENPQFASKYFTWLEKLNGSNQIPLKTYVAALEVLTKEPMQYQLAQFNSRSFEKFEIFLQISTEQYNAEKDQASVSSSQGLQFFKELLSSFHSKNPPNDRNLEAAANLLVATFFKEGVTSVSWRDFMYDIKQNLPFINKMVKLYFTGKFIERTQPLHLPILLEQSYILTNEILGIFYLSNSFFQSVPKIQLLYSSAKSGTSFNRLAYAIKGYDGPTMILIKHTQPEDEHRGIPKSSHVFGGFSKSCWHDQLKYQGDSESYIFSLTPKFKAYYAYRGSGGTNYTYLNTRKIQGSKYKPGLGFGGDEYKNYRIWLDDELEAESYAGADDATYERGFLVDPSIHKFNIEHVEIWGLGGEHAVMAQQEFRQQEIDLIESQRKVDKKAFLQSGFDREMFLGNTFKTSERADQTDFRAEMEKEAQQKNEKY